MSKGIRIKSTIKCPVCKFEKELQMPLYIRRIQYDCESCHARMKTRPDACCVFCSYGSVPCPSAQLDQHEQKDQSQD